MDDVLLEWRGYRYFPYELDFARWEAERLFTSSVRENEAGLHVPADAFRRRSAERLTYFARVVCPNGDSLIPRQARLEATAHSEDRQRQATRYSAHGLHEYKGKFNPQVVSAICNILGLPDDASVLDPFCGSGTTLLECAHFGRNARGIDRNPLAAQIANAKVRALRQAHGPLAEWASATEHLLRRAAETLCGPEPVSAGTIERELGPLWTDELPAWDYLSSWFPVPVLAQVVAIRRAIRASVPTDEDRHVFDVVLSDCLRDASLQDPGDLRIRRRKDAQPNYPLVNEFTAALQDRAARIARARETLGEVRGHQAATLGDIRTVELPRESFDAVITSPPYETALPYIDTQRLSLVLLGHVGARQIQKTEQELIGARDIASRERRQREVAIADGDPGLPRSVVELSRELLSASRLPGNGFRRRNRPALMHRYFHSMAAFFRSVRPALRPGARVALVVGTNRTTLGGREFEIDTPKLLADVAAHCGYERLEERAMDTYPRFALHRANSIEAETLVVLAA